MDSPAPPSQRILVTGAAGFLGGAVMNRLASRPEVQLVVAVDRVKPRANPEGGVLFVRRDVREGLRDLFEEHEIDAVVHHAFMIRQQRDLRLAEEVNVDATATLAADAQSAGVRRIVYPSSTTTYGARPGTGRHDESDRSQPNDGFMYARHKVAAEQALRSSQGEGAAAILRCCVVLGPDADNFITSSLSLPILPVAAGFDPDMQFLHIDDYVAAVDMALGAPGGGTWNVAGSGAISWKELIRLAGSRPVSVPAGLLRGIVGATWRLRLQNRSDTSGLPLVQHPWLASTTRIESEWGWIPRYSSREAAEAWARGLRRHRA